MGPTPTTLDELSPADRDVVESWLHDFSQTWHEGKLAEVVDHLPAEGTLRQLAMCEMTKIDLRQHGQKGHKKKLESYLNEFPDLGTPDTVPVELIREELNVRRQLGEDITEDELWERFPRHAERLRQELDWLLLSGTALVNPAGSSANQAGTAGQTKPNSARATLGSDFPDPSPEAPAPKPAAPPPSQRYRVVRPHARGSLGEVFIAHDEELPRKVALKSLQDRCAHDAESRARFILEAQISGRLEHPGVVPIYGVGTHADGRPYYAMRFVEGASLKDAIARYHAAASDGADAGHHRVELRQLLGRFIAVCQAIEFAHGKNVLHRDLKPDNIMVGKHGETLVVDWGLAKVMDANEPPSADSPPRPRDDAEASMTQTGDLRGSPAYMSPEQAAGQVAKLGPASDIYSLGATLYHLLTGRAAFRGKELHVVLQDVCRGNFPRPRQIDPKIPAGLEAVCLKAMALRPEKRYASAQALADDIERWLADEPVTAHAEPISALVGRWLRRHRTLVTGGVALLVTAVVGLVIATVLIAEEGQKTEKERQAAVQAEEQEKLARADADRQRDKAIQAGEATKLALAQTEEARADADKKRGEAVAAQAEAEKERQAAELAHKNELAARRQRALAEVAALLTATPRAVPSIINTLKQTPEDVLPRLHELRNKKDAPDQLRLRVGLALLALDPAALKDLLAALPALMLQADDPEDLLLVRDALHAHGKAVSPKLWQKADDPKTLDDERFRTLAALATLDGDPARWLKADWAPAQTLSAQTPAAYAAERLLTANPLQLGLWTEALRPVRAHLRDPLRAAFGDPRSSGRRVAAARLLADFAADQPEALAGLALDAEDEQYLVLRPRLKAEAVPVFRKELARPNPDDPAEQVAVARRQAHAAVAMLQLGQAEEVWKLNLLRHARDTDPTRRTFFLHALGRRGTDPALLVKRLLAKPAPEVSERRALILSLGEFTERQLPPEKREPLTRELLKWYRDDPDAGVHAALDWLLRHGQQGQAPRKLDWQQAAALQKIDQERAGQAPGGRDWLVTAKEGHTLAVIRDPAAFSMGSPPEEARRWKNEALHLKKIPRSFAVATREVTVAQFGAFLKANKWANDYHDPEHTKMYSPDPNGPAVGVTFYEAAAYCNWLSEQNGLDKSQWCYEINPGEWAVNKQVNYKPRDWVVKLAPNALQRQGFRLPTETEWEYACRAGAGTRWHFGVAEGMLAEYAWTVTSSDDRARPVGQLKPNDLGLFDLHGNAWEWCQDRAAYDYPKNLGNQPVLDELEKESALAPDRKCVMRGGSFFNRAAIARSAQRYLAGLPHVRVNDAGFRVVQTVRP